MSELLLEQTSVRRPESEIYGRSLSTIHRLGAFMVDKSLSEVITSPESDQARAEFYTSVEEGFGTDMELGGGLEVRDFDERSVAKGRVMSKDLKTPVSAMTGDGLECAKATAKNDKRFLSQLIRSEWDHENALIVDQMVRGETGYNTRIVVSPFPEEAAAESGNEYWQKIGYVPHLKRGFVQLYHASKEGGLIAGSLSFDGSNKQRLLEVFSQYNIEIPHGEITDNWLKYAITGTMPESEAKALAVEIADQSGDLKHKNTTNTVDVTREYGSIMDRVFNDSYIHVCESLYKGYQTDGAMQLVHQLADKAHHFSARYAKALYKMRANKNEFTDGDSVVLHELLVYSTIEMMRALHLKEAKYNYRDTNHAQSGDMYIRSLDTLSFQGVLSSFGAVGARNNRTYSACGLSISLGIDDEGESPQTAFGGIEKAGTLPDDMYGSRYFKCPKGHLNIRWKKNELIDKCRICKCDVSCKK